MPERRIDKIFVQAQEVRYYLLLQVCIDVRGKGCIHVHIFYHLHSSLFHYEYVNILF